MLKLTQPPKDRDISQQIRIELMVLLQQWGHTRKCQSEWGEWWWTMTLVSFWGTPSSDKSHVCVCLCQNLGISSIQVTFEEEEPPTSTNGYGLENSLHIPWWKLPWIYHGTSLGSWGWLKAMELSIWITSCFPFRWKRWIHKVRIKAAITGQEGRRHVSREREGGMQPVNTCQRLLRIVCQWHISTVSTESCAWSWDQCLVKYGSRINS